MLIELINTRDINLDNTQVETCIQHILCAHSEGKHIVISDKKFLKKLADKESLGTRNRNAAQNISQKIRELFPLKEKVGYYCKVDMSSISTKIIKNDPDDSFFVVGCCFFTDSSKTQLTKLLCEDINDYKIYEKIAQNFKFSQKLPGININFEVINGGGANIRNNFEQIKLTERLCLCLLDTDKKHPKSSIGSTAGKFNPSCTSSLCQYYIIESHEVESLIPMGIIEEAILQKKLDSSYLYAHEQLNALVSYSPNIKQHFDHKMGITINEAKKLDEKYQDNFWKEPLTNAPNFKRRGKCLQKMSCDCKNSCFAVPGFSTRLLDVSAEVLLKISQSKLDELIPELLKREWDNIGRQLFSWGCAMSQRTRSS